MPLYCSDCAHCRPEDAQNGVAAFKFGRCARPSSAKPDGYALTHPDAAAESLPFCRVERMTRDRCDTEGKFFQPKEASDAMS